VDFQPFLLPLPAVTCLRYESALAPLLNLAMALPDDISVILAQVLGPQPRGVPLVHLPASTQKTTASPQTSQVRHTNMLRQCNFNTFFFLGCGFDKLAALSTVEGQSFANVQVPIRLVSRSIWQNYWWVIMARSSVRDFF